MKGIDRKVLAQNASFVLVAAACANRSQQWNAGEVEHARASTKEQAQAAAAPLLELCARCPILVQCRSWAQVDSYSGIAAGAAWRSGKQRPAYWVRRPLARWLAS